MQVTGLNYRHYLIPARDVCAPHTHRPGNTGPASGVQRFKTPTELRCHLGNVRGEIAVHVSGIGMSPGDPAAQAQIGERKYAALLYSSTDRWVFNSRLQSCQPARDWVWRSFEFRVCIRCVCNTVIVRGTVGGKYRSLPPVSHPLPFMTDQVDGL